MRQAAGSLYAFSLTRQPEDADALGSSALQQSECGRFRRLRFRRGDRRRQAAQELEIVPVPDAPGSIADLGRRGIPTQAFPVGGAFEVDEEAGGREGAE